MFLAQGLRVFSMRESTIQSNHEVGRCGVIKQVVSFNRDVKFTLGFAVVQVEGCRHSFYFVELLPCRGLASFPVRFIPQPDVQWPSHQRRHKAFILLVGGHGCRK